MPKSHAAESSYDILKKIILESSLSKMIFLQTVHRQSPVNFLPMIIFKNAETLASFKINIVTQSRPQELVWTTCSLDKGRSPFPGGRLFVCHFLHLQQDSKVQGHVPYR